MINRFALIHVPVSNGVVRVQTEENYQGAREARSRLSHSMPGQWYGGAMRWSGLRNDVRCSGGGAVAGRRFQACKPDCRAYKGVVCSGGVVWVMLAGRRANRRRDNSDVDWDEVVAAPLECGENCCKLARSAALRCHGGCAELALHSTMPTLFSRVSHAALQVWSQKAMRRKARQVR